MASTADRRAGPHCPATAALANFRMSSRAKSSWDASRTRTSGAIRPGQTTCVRQRAGGRAAHCHCPCRSSGRSMSFHRCDGWQACCGSCASASPHTFGAHDRVVRLGWRPSQSCPWPRSVPFPAPGIFGARAPPFRSEPSECRARPPAAGNGGNSGRERGGREKGGRASWGRGTRRNGCAI